MLGFYDACCFGVLSTFFFLWLQEYLNSHIKDRHNKTFKCNVCEKSFGYEYSLESHKKTVHLGIKPFKCDLCHDCFSSNKLLQRHIRGAHNKEKPFQCSKCSRTFKTTAKLGSKYELPSQKLSNLLKLYLFTSVKLDR